MQLASVLHLPLHALLNWMNVSLEEWGHQHISGFCCTEVYGGKLCLSFPCMVHWTQTVKKAPLVWDLVGLVQCAARVFNTRDKFHNTEQSKRHCAASKSNNCHNKKKFQYKVLVSHVTWDWPMACWIMTSYSPPPHPDRMTDTYENITFRNFVCGQ